MWIFYVQFIGGNKSLCPARETIAANSVYSTPFLAFKLWFCRHSGNKYVILHSYRRRQFESKNQIARDSLTDYTTHGQTKKGHENGEVGGYHWGVERKRALLEKEVHG
jgi:hypothetical protein